MISRVLTQVMLFEDNSQVTKNDERERNVKGKIYMKKRPKGEKQSK